MYNHGHSKTSGKASTSQTRASCPRQTSQEIVKRLTVTLRRDFLFGYNGIMKLSIKNFIRHPATILSTWFVFVFAMVVILPAVSYNASIAGLNESIDTNFSFDPQAIYSILDGYGESGRIFYVRQRWTFDLIWPLIYGMPLYLTLNRFVLSLHKLLKWIKVTPLLAVLFDYLENVVFTFLALSFPSQFVYLEILGVMLSFIKWVLLMTAMISTLIYSMLALFRYIRPIKISS